MNKYISFFKTCFAPLFIFLLAMTMVFAGCSDDDDELQQTAFGYVQFKIYKSASAAIKGTETRGTDMLDKLNDAKKIKVVMLYDGNTIEQTLMLNSYSAENAEFGLRSDKLELLAGNYKLIGYYLYDKLDISGREGRDFCLKENLCPDVFLLKLIPGTNPDIFDRLLEMKYRGIIIEAFGAGGTHFERRNLVPKLEKLIHSGISVVARSQCLYEKSDFSLYEVGRKLLDCGVIQGRDMTTEAIVTKLMWALGQTEDSSKVREIFNTDYAGEVTLGYGN